MFVCNAAVMLWHIFDSNNLSGRLDRTDETCYETS